MATTHQDRDTICPVCEKPMWVTINHDAHCGTEDCGMRLINGTFYAPPKAVEKMRDETRIHTYNQVCEMITKSQMNLSTLSNGYMSDMVMGKIDELEILRLQVQGLRDD